MDVNAHIQDLEERMKRQEDLHPDITLTKPGFIHGVLRFAPFIVGTVILSSIVAHYVAKSVNK